MSRPGPRAGSGPIASSSRELERSRAYLPRQACMGAHRYRDLAAQPGGPGRPARPVYTSTYVDMYARTGRYYIVASNAYICMHIYARAHVYTVCMDIRGSTRAFGSAVQTRRAPARDSEPRAAILKASRTLGRSIDPGPCSPGTRLARNRGRNLRANLIGNRYIDHKWQSKSPQFESNLK